MKLIFTEPQPLEVKKTFWILFFTLLVVSLVVVFVFSLVRFEHFLIEYLKYSYGSPEEKNLRAIFDGFQKGFVILALPIMIYSVVFLMKFFKIDKDRSQLVFNKNNFIYKISDGQRIIKEVEVRKENITQEAGSALTIHENNFSYTVKGIEPASIFTHLFVWKTLGFPIGSEMDPNRFRVYLEFSDIGIRCVCMDLRNDRTEKISLVQWHKSHI